MSICSYTPPKASGYKTWTFQNPVITVTRRAILSGWGKRNIGLHITYTVRAMLFATSAQDLNEEIFRAEKSLLHNQGEFVWKEADAEIVRADSKLDMRWGPYVTGWNVEQFWGVQCARITWQMETYCYTDAQKNKTGTPYDMVYTIGTRLSQNFYTERTLTGVLTLRACGLELDANALRREAPFDCADNYRATIQAHVCPCPKGWQRLDCTFQLSEDGLSLAFTIIDQQRFALLPKDVTDGTVSLYANATFSAPGITSYDQLSHTLTVAGWFEAPSDRSKACPDAVGSLLNGIINVNTALFPESGAMLEYTLQRELYRNYLGFTFKWAFKPIESDTMRMIPDKATQDWGYSSHTGWGYTRNDEGDKPDASGLKKVAINSVEAATWKCSVLIMSANVWLASYKNIESTPRSLYGTTDVRGYCGKGRLAPVLAADDNASTKPLPGSGGATSAIDANETPKKSTTKDKTVPYYSWTQEFHYHFDYGRVTLPVKKADTDDIVQQIHAPQIFLEVFGETIASNKHGQPPPPYTQANEGGILLRQDIELGTPINGAMRTTWRYLVKVPLAEHRIPATVTMPIPLWVEATPAEMAYPVWREKV